jgi:Tol biopolymer transport system component
MNSWTRFVEWCREPSRIRIRSFNPKNIMVVELSVLLVSLLTSGTWLFAARFSITQANPIFASISGDGSKVAFAAVVDGDYEVFVVNSDGTGLTQLTDNQATDQCVSISDDGSKIAFHSNVDGDYEIFVINSDGTGLKQLTKNTAIDKYASISGDGTKIAYNSDVDGDDEIFVANSDGTGLTQLTNNTTTDWFPSINSNGTKLAYMGSFGAGFVNGSVVNSDVTGITRLCPSSPHSYPSISGDGSKMAGHGYGYWGIQIQVANTDGTLYIQLNHSISAIDHHSSISGDMINDQHASISGDGSKVAFHSNVDGDCEIFVANTDGTGMTQLTHNQANDAFPSISNDGTKIAYTSDVNGDNEVFLIANGVATPLTMPVVGFNFPVEFAAAGIVAVIVSVVATIIFFGKK